MYFLVWVCIVRYEPDAPNDIRNTIDARDMNNELYEAARIDGAVKEKKLTYSCQKVILTTKYFLKVI